MAEGEEPPVSYEDLALIEAEFEDVDTEIMRKQYDLSAPLYAKRTEVTRKIPNFWPLVIEQAPPDIDQWIQPHDSRIIAESLLNIEVRRPELDNKGSGNPRSVSIKLEFKPNQDFEDTVLEKTFWHRRAKDGWSGLVSEPVRVHWKKGKDLTEGLTDGAVALWEARKKTGDMTAKTLPEYYALKKKVDSWNGSNTSFFTWFGWVSGRRWVSAEESEEANRMYLESKEKRMKAAKSEGDAAEDTNEDEDQEEENDDEAVEVHQAGEELAISFAEELWPNALKLFTQAQDDDISEIDFEDMDTDEEDEDDDDEPIDIRALVQDKGGKARSRDSTGGGAAPPSKKQKKK
ncbi:uncharacterized protein LTR77_009844 [Saxophila tyrrhenica]|uniref:Nucleosome assembly protein n=1 Tax=Saxophila tyrrhenica TaxID=1690608 RepID=A0AAV9NY43_9PEZI|nr:hypothetical protein LTR77_009844 [Saxophila tyrrhenica]